MAKTPIQALITRPEEDAATLADALRQRGVGVAIEPLLSIRTLPGVAIDLDGVQALLFTSSNGVRAFAELSQRRDLPCFTVGDATAAAASSAGFAEVHSAGGDVRDLARLVSEKLQPAGGLLFHAAASAVAGDLAAAVEGAGFGLRRAVIYEAKPAERLADETLRRLADGAIDWVLFFSPRTAATFVRLIDAAPPAERLRLAAGIARTEALCLSPAVADAVQKLAWRSVLSALRPDLPGMLQLVDATLAETAPAPVKAPKPVLPVTPPVLPTPPQAPATRPAGRAVSDVAQYHGGAQASWRAMARCSFAGASVTIGQVPHSPASGLWRMPSGAGEMTVASGVVTRDVLMMPGGQRVLGHALEFGRDPLALFQRAREHGDVVRIRFGPFRVYLLNSPDAIRQAIARVAHRGGRPRRLGPTSVGVRDIGCSFLSRANSCAARRGGAQMVR